MRFELDDYTRGLSDEELLADLRSVAERLGKLTVTIEEYDDYGRCHPCTLQRRFGSWFTALDKAGLKRTRHLGISNEDLFTNLENVWIQLVRQPRYNEMRSPLSEYSGSTYENRFGSWRKALHAFVEYANSESEGIETESDDALECNHAISEVRHKTKRSVSHRLRFLVLRRDKFKCSICGKTPATHPSTELVVDHIFAWTKEGETVLENLQTLCVECNSGKSDLDMVQDYP